MRWNKKGLELPITAIIVLIIAITFLGLAIYFIRTMWERGTSGVESQFALLEEQERRSIEQLGKIISFTFGPKLNVKKGERKDFRVYLKSNVGNTDGDTVCHVFRIKCLQAMSEGNVCEQGKPEGTPVIVGGFDETLPGEDVLPSEKKWFPRMVTKKLDIPNHAYVRSEATVQTNVNPDIYSMEAELLVEKNAKSCRDASEFVTAGTELFTIDLG